MVYCVGCGASVQDNVDTCSFCSSRGLFLCRDGSGRTLEPAEDSGGVLLLPQRPSACEGSQGFRRTSDRPYSWIPPASSQSSFAMVSTLLVVSVYPLRDSTHDLHCRVCSPNRSPGRPNGARARRGSSFPRSDRRRRRGALSEVGSGNAHPRSAGPCSGVSSIRESRSAGNRLGAFRRGCDKANPGHRRRDHLQKPSFR